MWCCRQLAPASLMLRRSTLCRPRTENNCDAAGGAYLGAGSKNGDMWTPEEDNIIDMAVRMQAAVQAALPPPRP